MPRLTRLDAPGVLHHVMGWGIERKKIFYNDIDPNSCVTRLISTGQMPEIDGINFEL